MKRFLLIAIVLFFTGVGVTVAAPITLIDNTTFDQYGTNASEDLDSFGGQSVSDLEYTGDWVTWTHYFDFNPAVDEIISATLVISLIDDEGDVWYNPFTWEIALGWAEDGSWALGGVNTGDYAFDIDGLTLVDGDFSVNLVSLWGDFSIESSELTITYEPAPVPEPSTMLLMGAGLVGLIGVRRWKLKR